MFDIVHNFLKEKLNDVKSKLTSKVKFTGDKQQEKPLPNEVHYSLRNKTVRCSISLSDCYFVKQLLLYKTTTSRKCKNNILNFSEYSKLEK